MKSQKTYLAVAAVLATSAVMVAAPVYANESNARNNSIQAKISTITIPTSKVVKGDNGSIRELSLKTGLNNGDYKVKVVATNQKSTHPGSDIIVRSGVNQVVVEDVEKEAFKNKTANQTLTVKDETVTVYVKLGKDKVFSGGVDVVLTQVPAAPEEEPETVATPVTPATPATPAPEAATPAEPAPAAVPVPEELPKAGASTTVALMALLASVAGYFGHLKFSRIRG